MELLEVTGSTNFFQDMTLEEEAKTLESLNLEQILLQKRAKIMSNNVKISEEFITSLTDKQAYRIYRAYVESTMAADASVVSSSASFMSDF